MKYDLQLADLKNQLPAAKNILIALPFSSTADKLAAGLALFLTLGAAGKQVNVVCDDNILVGQAHLFGVDHIQKNLPSTDGGNLTLTLEGVTANDGTVPALEKLDWYAEGGHLNLVFHVLPGQTFQPARIIPRYQGSGFNMIFVIGATGLNALGNIYLQNQNAFSGGYIVNIDNQTTNAAFGQTNVVDTNVSSVSEIMANLISDLGYSLDTDSASNLLSGIFAATGNLSDTKVTADTYLAVAMCLRAGGKKPVETTVGTGPQSVIAQTKPTYDWNAVSAAINPQSPQPSPEEKPVGEGVVSETVEPEWLTPKIFKGSSLS